MPQASSFALVLYLFFAAMFMFAAAYTLVIWVQIRGLRGLMMTLLFFSLAIICSTIAWLHTGDARLPLVYVLSVRRAMWTLAGFAVLVLADLYAAASNDHRSLTTRWYLWFKRIARERADESSA